MWVHKTSNWGTTNQTGTMFTHILQDTMYIINSTLHRQLVLIKLKKKMNTCQHMGCYYYYYYYFALLYYYGNLKKQKTKNFVGSEIQVGRSGPAHYKIFKK